jgi:N-acyl-D-aspartate/D-glutamate deacylase
MRAPFTFASYPCWHPVFNKSKDEQARIYADPAFRSAFREALLGPAVFNGDWRRITLAAVSKPAMRALEGRTVADIAAERGSDEVDTFLDLDARGRSRSRVHLRRLQLQRRAHAGAPDRTWTRCSDCPTAARTST